MFKKTFLKTVNLVVVTTFLFTNRAWANQMPADKLAAQSQVNSTLALAKAVYTGTALHSALIMQDVKELQTLYYNQAKIRGELRKKIGGLADSLKTLIFADKADPKKIAYYTFTTEGYFYRFTNAENVDDPFYSLIKARLTSPLDNRPVLIGTGTNRYNQETFQVPADTVDLINSCLGELYPDSKMKVSAGIKAEHLKDEKQEYFVVDKSSGGIVERLSVSGVRVLRKKGLSALDVQEGIESGSFVVKTKEEMLADLNRANCGIGITGGGDCAGIADFLGSLRQGLDSRLTMLGVRYAGKGLMVPPEKFTEQLILVDDLAAEDFIGQASTPFGSARENPLKKARDNTVANIGGHGFFYGTGGNDHLGLLEQIAKEFPDMVVVGTFKSIDGDGWVNGRPAQMLGFNSAVNDYRNAIWSAAQNARTHGEAHVIEVFGRNCGKLAFESARRYPPDFEKLSKEEQRKITECGDRMLILAPEKPVTLRNIAEKAKSIKTNEGSCVIVVAEGFLPPELKQEMYRLANDAKLKARWLDGKIAIEEIPNLINYKGDDDPRRDLFAILKDRELAAQFGKTVWETELDAHGNVTKLAGIRKFIIQALIKLGGIKKVNEILENYEARGASPTKYDSVMGQKIGRKMAEMVNQGVKGGKAVVYFEGMDAMTEDPVVVDLVGVSDKNNLNNPDLYPDEVLQENGVFWVKPKATSNVKNLSAFSGVPVILNLDTGDIALGEGLDSESIWERPMRDAGNSIADPSIIAKDYGRVVYYGYRNARMAGDKATIDELKLRFDITVLLPGLIGEEFIMTKGHIHPGTNYPEFYEVWNGAALFIQQGTNPSTGKFELIATLAKPGDKVLLIPGYSHRTVNVSDEPLVIANWICDEVGGKEGIDGSAKVKPDFSDIEENNGYAHHVIKGPDGGIILKQNPKYGDTPCDIRFALPAKEIPELGLSNKEAMYGQFANRALSEFLRDSHGKEGLFAKAFDFADAEQISQVLGRPLSVESIVEEGINNYLNERYSSGQMPKAAYDEAKRNVLTNIKKWLDKDYMSNPDPAIQKILDQTRIGIEKAIREKRWADLVNAFFKDIVFGTAGIRGMAFFGEEDEQALFNEGLDAPILKGTNTINDVIFMRYSAGVARYMKKNGKERVVIAYDSRIQGKAFAERVAGVFLAEGITVYFFDQVSPMPELSFAVTNLDERFGGKKDTLGILVSASHNPKEYNGYKIVNSSGAQLNLAERAEIVTIISEVRMDDVNIKKLEDAVPDKFVWLGGRDRLTTVNYGAYQFIDMHSRHVAKVREHLLVGQDLLDEYAPSVNVGYAAFYGSGAVSVPRMLNEIGFTNLKTISKLSELDGRFPGFVMPDPGDVVSWGVAIEKFIKQYGHDKLDKIDIIVGTDPDADRMGVVIKTPEGMGNLGAKKNFKLLTANEAWSLLLYFELSILKERGEIPEDPFIVKSHVTTGALRNIARKFGVATEETFVGFSLLADKIIQAWNEGRINLGAFEESNGYSIGGEKPEAGKALGRRGHTLEKDGTMAAVKIAQIAAYAKSKNTTIYDLINEMRLDPEVGYFGTDNQPIEFRGVEGLAQRTEIMRWVQEQLVKKVSGTVVYKTWDKVNNRIIGGTKTKNVSEEPLVIAGKRVVAIDVFQSGKYDKDTFPGFADEGVRFYFDDTGENHITIRPSGTEPKIRVYVQWKAAGLTRENMDAEVKKIDDLIAELEAQAKALILASMGTAVRGSHIVRKVSGEEAVKGEEPVYTIKKDANGRFEFSKTEGEHPDDKIVMLEGAINRLEHIYGTGVFTIVKEIQVVNNLNAGGLYPNGRAPLASYADGILKIDTQALVYNVYIAFEEIEHEFLESMAGLIPGSNQILSDVTATFWNAKRYLNPNEGVTDDKFKWGVGDYQTAFMSVLESKENPIDPDGEYLTLLKRLRDLQGEIKDDDDVIALVVIYVFRTKLYETVRDQLGIPEDLARQIKAIDLKKGDALTVFNEIAKAKQVQGLTAGIKEEKQLPITVVKTFTGLRVNGLDEISDMLAKMVGAETKQIGSLDKLTGTVTKSEGVKYILVDDARLEELKTTIGEGEYNRIVKQLGDNNYKIRTELPSGIELKNVIKLIDPADLENTEKKDGMLYLPPMPITRSSLFMAANIVSAGGDAGKVDILVKGFVRDLYGIVLSREVTDEDLMNLFTKPWVFLPQIRMVLRDIDNLRKAVVLIEKAA